MYGAIVGDFIGSVYESQKCSDWEKFPISSDKSKFTDDTIMTIAVEEWLLSADNLADLDDQKLVQIMQSYGQKYPDRGYGANFSQWIQSENPQPYNSYGNGSAMRVSGVAWKFDNMDDVRSCARRSAAITHNHAEGIKGAEAIAAAVFLARTGKSKADIKAYIVNEFDYDLEHNCDEIRKNSHFDDTCQVTVPLAIVAFLESTDFENAIRLAVSLGGDSDTIACMTGAIAEAYYGRLPNTEYNIICALPSELRDVVEAFRQKYVFINIWHEGDLRLAGFKIPKLNSNEIFVFGSNLSGLHGGGAARTAYERYGAQWGVGVGLTGQTYAIPTMQGGIDTIKPYTDEFTEFAKKHSDLIFLVTRIGCGIAGFKETEMAPLFAESAKLPNVYLPFGFWKVINQN